jgi:dolichol kinase
MNNNDRLLTGLTLIILGVICISITPLGYILLGIGAWIIGDALARK